MRRALAAAGLWLLVAGCAADIPGLHPDLSAAQIAALPGRSQINDAHYVSTFTGPDGTVYSSQSGTVDLRPTRALSQVTTLPPAGKGGFVPGEYREIMGTGFAPANPVYFDRWATLGPFQVEGQEGSAVDRAWRLVAHPVATGFSAPQVSLRLWIRQRDGYPLQYQMDFVKGSTR